MRFNHLARTFCSVALASVMLSGITCTPQQARAEGPQFDAEYLARKNQFGEQWASRGQVNLAGSKTKNATSHNSLEAFFFFGARDQIRTGVQSHLPILRMGGHSYSPLADRSRLPLKLGCQRDFLIPVRSAPMKAASRVEYKNPLAIANGFSVSGARDQIRTGDRSHLPIL